VFSSGSITVSLLASRLGYIVLNNRWQEIHLREPFLGARDDSMELRSCQPLLFDC
jgi:hypothetical protein